MFSITTTALSTSIPMPTMSPSSVSVLSVLPWAQMTPQATMSEKGMQSTDTVVMETTYGDRAHKALGPSIDELYDAIRETFRRGGNVIIPTFALERAQELLFCLRQGVQDGEEM